MKDTLIILSKAVDRFILGFVSFDLERERKMTAQLINWLKLFASI